MERVQLRSTGINLLQNENSAKQLSTAIYQVLTREFNCAKLYGNKYNTK